MLVRSPRFLKGERRLREQAEQLLAKVGLLDDADVQASSLPYGKQRRLEIARALALQPSLLLLDEPAAGMVDEEQQDLAQLLRELRSEGLTLLVIDHNIRFLLSVVDRVQVMNHGQLIAEGEPDKVVADPAVIEAYLGQEVEA
jgi:branched-chain amino acid transport system ATP-binding protein